MLCSVMSWNNCSVGFLFLEHSPHLLLLLAKSHWLSPLKVALLIVPKDILSSTFLVNCSVRNQKGQSSSFQSLLNFGCLSYRPLVSVFPSYCLIIVPKSFFHTMSNKVYYFAFYFILQNAIRTHNIFNWVPYCKDLPPPLCVIIILHYLYHHT